MHQTVDSLVLNLSSFCPHFVLAWIRSVYTNKRPMTVQSDLHSEALLLSYDSRKFISTASLKQLRTKCAPSLSQRCLGNRSDPWHAVIPNINPLAKIRGETGKKWDMRKLREPDWGHRGSIKKWSVISDSAVCIESIAQSVQEIASCCDCHVSIHLTVYTPPNVVSRRRCFPCVCVGGKEHY